MFKLLHLSQTDEIPVEWQEAFKKGKYRLYKSVHEVHTILIRCVNNNNDVGFLKGAIYKKDSIDRCYQWCFGNNKERVVWVDSMSCLEKRKGYGSKMLTMFEEYIKKIPFEGKRNIYVMSVIKSEMFYIKQGYTPVCTRDHPHDEDYPSTFFSEVGGWLAKPLGDQIDQEEIAYVRSKFQSEMDLDYALRVYDLGAIANNLDIEKFISTFGSNVQDYIDGKRDVHHNYSRSPLSVPNPFDFKVDQWTLEKLVGLVVGCFIDKKQPFHDSKFPCHKCKMYRYDDQFHNRSIVCQNCSINNKN